MNNYSCSICSSTSKKIGDIDDYKIIRCKNCLLEEVFNKPKGNFLSDLYAERQIRIWKDLDFESYFHDFNCSDNNPKRDQFCSAVNIALKRSNKSYIKILEIGCGKAPLVNWSNKNGHKAIGVESSELISKFLSLNCNLDIRYIPNNDYSQITENDFDLIYLEHSLEHHSDLLLTLKTLNRRLSNTGIIHIKVPNHGSKIAKLKKLKWLNYSPPHHLYFFTSESIVNVLNITNYKIIEIEESLYFTNGIWLFYSIDKYINFTIRVLNKLFNLKIIPIKPKNKYPESFLDYLRLIPFYIFKKRAKEELSVTACVRDQ